MRRPAGRPYRGAMPNVIANGVRLLHYEERGERRPDPLHPWRRQLGARWWSRRGGSRARASAVWSPTTGAAAGAASARSRTSALASTSRAGRRRSGAARRPGGDAGAGHRPQLRRQRRVGSRATASPIACGPSWGSSRMGSARDGTRRGRLGGRLRRPTARGGGAGRRPRARRGADHRGGRGGGLALVAGTRARRSARGQRPGDPRRAARARGGFREDADTLATIAQPVLLVCTALQAAPPEFHEATGSRWRHAIPDARIARGWVAGA